MITKDDLMMRGLILIFSVFDSNDQLPKKCSFNINANDIPYQHYQPGLSICSNVNKDVPIIQIKSRHKMRDFNICDIYDIYISTFVSLHTSQSC